MSPVSYKLIIDNRLKDRSMYRLIAAIHVLHTFMSIFLMSIVPKNVYEFQNFHQILSHKLTSPPHLFVPHTTSYIPITRSTVINQKTLSEARHVRN